MATDKFAGALVGQTVTVRSTAKKPRDIAVYLGRFEMVELANGDWKVAKTDDDTFRARLVAMGAHAYATATVEASVPMLTADQRARHAAGETVLVGYSVADGYVYATDEGQVRMVTPEGETDITVRLGGAVPQPGQWVWLLASVVAA